MVGTSDLSDLSSLSDPFEILTVEHYPIIQVASALAAMRSDSEVETEILRKAIEFIRRFADRYHHEKEEVILFTHVREKGLDVSPIEAMEKEHEMIRDKIRRAIEGLDKGDIRRAVISLREWANFIPDHIDRENHSLFPGLARFFDQDERDEMMKKFRKVDQELGTILDMQKMADELFLTITGKTGEAIVEARAIKNEDRDAFVERLAKIMPENSSLLVMYDEKPVELMRRLEEFQIQEVRKGDVYAFRVRHR
jgi:hemerythrin-like domain-containing protein